MTQRLTTGVSGMVSYCIQRQMEGHLSPSCYMISEAIAGACLELGIDAEVLHADAYAWNQDMERLLTDERLFKKWSNLDNLGFRAKAKMRQIRPKFVGIHNGQDVEGPGYNGHVVVRIEGEMVDCTIHQFNRPEYNLQAPVLALISMSEFSDLAREQGITGDNMMIAEESITPEMVIKPFGGERGYMLYSIRRGLEKDYFDMSKDTKKNIEVLKDRLVEIAKGVESGEIKIL